MSYRVIVKRNLRNRKLVNVKRFKKEITSINNRHDNELKEVRTLLNTELKEVRTLLNNGLKEVRTLLNNNIEDTNIYGMMIWFSILIASYFIAKK